VLEWPLAWKPLEIRVTSVVRDPDRDAPRSVSDIETLPDLPPGTPWRYLGPGVATALVAVLVLCWCWRHRQRAAPAQTATEAALADLHELDVPNPVPGDMARLADILRAFLERRLELSGTRQTSSELIGELRRTGGLSDSTLERIGFVLSRCDLVKFAGLTPSIEECQALVVSARECVIQVGEAGTTGPSA
jgi:hypothetical protein